MTPTGTSPRIGAVVLAGGKVPAALAGVCAHRALLRIGERFALEYLLGTLAQAPSIIDTVLVAPADALPELASLPGRQVNAGDTLVENMQLGARALADCRPTHLIFITGDIPLLTIDGVEDYLTASLHSGAHLTYPIIPRDVCEASFPGAKRTYVRLKDGAFTGGNAIFTTATLLDDKQALIQSLYLARKNPLKLAGLLGWPTVARMLTGTLTLSYVENVAARILQAPVKAIVTPFAEIGFDVDKAEDLAAVERALALPRKNNH